MAERKAILRTKDGWSQIGYVEGNEAFDLSGTMRCNYDPVSGNLLNAQTGKVVGHVSLKGVFVGASWISAQACKGGLPLERVAARLLFPPQ